MESIQQYKINFLVILHLVAVVGLIFPYGFPLFSVITILFFFYGIITNNLQLKVNNYTILLYITLLTYIFGVTISYEMYNTVIKDLINILLIVIIILNLGKYNLAEYKKVLHGFFITFAFITPILAIISLYKYLLILNNIRIPYFEVSSERYPLGTSLMPDYNMYALGMLIGLIALSYLIKVSENTILQLFGILSSILVILSIVFSGSRRGWIILVFASLFLLYNLFVRFRLNNFKNNFIIIITSLLFLLMFLFGVGDKLEISVTNQHELEKLQYRFSTLDDMQDSFSPRAARWSYVLDLSNDFNILEVTLGSGFEYLDLFGEKFVEPGFEDHPHNPVFSAYLYSGVIGGLITILFLLIPLIRMILEKELFFLEYQLIYLIVLFFLIQSSNSVFSTNIFWLIIVHFCVIPMKKREVNYESSISSIK